MSDHDQITRARERYIDAVTDAVLAFLKKQGVKLTTRGEEQLHDLIRFETTP